MGLTTQEETMKTDDRRALIRGITQESVQAYLEASDDWSTTEAIGETYLQAWECDHAAIEDEELRRKVLQSCHSKVSRTIRGPMAPLVKRARVGRFTVYRTLEEGDGPEASLAGPPAPPPTPTPPPQVEAVEEEPKPEPVEETQPDPHKIELDIGLGHNTKSLVRQLDALTIQVGDVVARLAELELAVETGGFSKVLALAEEHRDKPIEPSERRSEPPKPKAPSRPTPPPQPAPKPCASPFEALDAVRASGVELTPFVEAIDRRGLRCWQVVDHHAKLAWAVAVDTSLVSEADYWQTAGAPA
jgi:hypothetical protein